MQSNSKDDENVSKTPPSDHYEQNEEHITEDPKGSTPSEANEPDDFIVIETLNVNTTNGHEKYCNIPPDHHKTCKICSEGSVNFHI